MTAAAPPRMLVAGASGLVGAHVVAAARPRWNTLGVARHVEGLATEMMELGDPASIERVVTRFEPDVVVVGSAFSWVDGCERDPVRSHRENVETVQALVKALPAQVRVVFYSTDHVFDGKRAEYVETDAVNPLSVYARHKLEAEQLLLARGRALIARTSYVFGRERRRKNFMYRVIDASKSHAPLQVPARQAGMPTWAGWLATSTVSLLERDVDGVVHLVGPELLTKAAWVRVLQEGLDLSPVNVVETSWEEAGQVAPRPERVMLKTRRHELVHPSLKSLLEQERASLLNPVE